MPFSFTPTFATHQLAKTANAMAASKTGLDEAKPHDSMIKTSIWRHAILRVAALAFLFIPIACGESNSTEPSIEPKPEYFVTILSTPG